MNVELDLVPGVFDVCSICFDIADCLNFWVEYTRNRLFAILMYEPWSGLVSWQDEHLCDVYVRGS